MCLAVTSPERDMGRTQTRHANWFALQRLQEEPSTEVAGAIASRFRNRNFVLASQPQELLPLLRGIRFPAAFGVSGPQREMHLWLPGGQPDRSLKFMRSPGYIQVSLCQYLPQDGMSRKIAGAHLDCFLGGGQRRLILTTLQILRRNTHQCLWVFGRNR